MQKRHVVSRLLKRFLDILISLVVLILMLPFFILISIAIRIDSTGPVFFRQDRLGLDGEIFRVFKFRSMVVGSPDGAVIEGNSDPRITWVGEYLRRWSLDELPQFINVLRGDMSLVGPRPDRVFRLDEYTSEQKTRLKMKPGLTGLAQINGRNSLEWNERCRLDQEYVGTWSLWSDVKIMLNTGRVVVKREGVNFKP